MSFRPSVAGPCSAGATPRPATRLAGETLVAMVAMVAMVTSCGSGVPLLISSSSSGSSSSSDAPFIVESLMPSEDLLSIEINFSKRVDISTINASSLSFERDEELIAFEDFVEEVVEVTPQDVELELASPLALGVGYGVEFLSGPDRVQAQGGGQLQGASGWRFDARDGVLRLEALVTFLAPIAGIQLLSDLTKVAAIEGGVGSTTVIGVTSASPGGDFGTPVVVHDTPLQTNQNGLTFSPDESVWTVAWTEDKLTCANIAGGLKGTGDVYLSQSVDRGLTWQKLQLDKSLNGTNNISWPPQIGELVGANGVNETVALWWTWGGQDLTEFQIHYAAGRAGEWTSADAEVLAPSVRSPGVAARRVVSWPFARVAPDARTLFVVWGEADEQFKIFDADSQGTWQSYWLGIYRDGTWTTMPIAGAGCSTGSSVESLPRITDFVLTSSRKGVILARSVDQGPRLFHIDLVSGCLIHEDTYDGGLVRLAPDEYRVLNCGNSSGGFSRGTVAPMSPRGARGGEGKLLVTWFAEPESGPGVGPVYINEYDLEGRSWVSSEILIEATLQGAFDDVTVRGPTVVVDQSGATTAVWSVLQDGTNPQGEPISEAYVQGKRKARDGTSFAPFACVSEADGPDEFGEPIECSEGLPNSPFLSDPDPNRCAWDHSIAVDPKTGRLVVSWNELLCDVTGVQTLASLFRVFD